MCEQWTPEAVGGLIVLIFFGLLILGLLFKA